MLLKFLNQLLNIAHNLFSINTLLRDEKAKKCHVLILPFAIQFQLAGCGKYSIKNNNNKGTGLTRAIARKAIAVLAFVAFSSDFISL